MNNHLHHQTSFPLGEKRTDNFTGDVYFKVIFNDSEPLNTPIANVTFAPGGRTKWHSHHEGQVILVTDGEGWYQEAGKKAQLIKKGDVVNFKKDVKHWHGATKESSMAHLAMTPGKTDWFETVEELPDK